MLRRASQKPLCGSCSKQLLDLFVGGFVVPSSRELHRRSNVPSAKPQRRLYHSSLKLRQDSSSDTAHRVGGINQDRTPESITELESPISEEHGIASNALESRVVEARQLFGETLPEGYLTTEEFEIYERLYGPPIAITSPEDEALLEPLENEDELFMENDLGGDLEQNSLFKETEEGDLEEVEYNSQELHEGEPDVDKLLTQQKGESAAQFQQRKELYETVAKLQTGLGSLDDQTAMLQDLQAAEQLAREESGRLAAEASHAQQGQMESFDESPPEDYAWSAEGFEEDEDVSHSRAHPLTAIGRSRTMPSTLRVPAVELVEPVQRWLAETARYEHLVESANSVFGGPRLPGSNATPHRIGPVSQKPPALSASSHNMSAIQANLFMAVIMPGAYASSRSILIEVRRRLGGEWLNNLLKRPGGPRILDAGAGGAGIIAWRELLAAQWDVMHENTISRAPVPLGISTVLAGSNTLQDSISNMLEETTFIPRLPDFSRTRDLPAERPQGETPRKQYDVIIAPYTLYGIEEGYIKKAHIQNLWSLLDPNGGVLIVLEKGVPKGFENIAEARKVLLEHHIRNPAPGKQEQIAPLIGNYHTNLEDGMIIAPCTNHKQCPMYSFAGEAVGRKDSCTFKQRYERPPFLQRIHGAKFHNHEDISFSYIAVQRGKDQRKELSFVQNEEATKQAFGGYEDKDVGEVHLQTLPRILNQPLKRTGHVTLDVCTPSGTYERWITPKSFSHQAYRDARKAQWGDLWALGAKTRVAVQARTGRPKDERKTSKINFENGEKYDTEQDQADRQRRQAENEKRRKARLKKSKAERQPKYANDTRKRLKQTEEDED